MFDEYTKYEQKAHRAMNQVSIVFDLARAAEKMCEWKNVGSSNKAWSEGPFIETPANQRTIDRSFPYIVRASIEARVIAKPASFTRVLIERSEGTDWWHRLSGSASSARIAVE